MFGRRNLIRFSSLIIVLVATIIGGPQSAGAQQPEQGTQLRISPALVDDTLDPGTRYQVPFQLVNTSENPTSVRAATRGLAASADVPAETAGVDASTWIVLDQADFSLLGGESRSVVATISVPPDAEPGGHYATVDFDAIGPTAPGATTVSPRVSATVLLTVSGAATRNVDVPGSVEVQTVQIEAGPTPFSVTLRNGGNIHALPQGNFVVRDVFGRKVSETPLELGILLPGAERRYESKWEHGPRIGMYRVSLEAAVGPDATLETNESRFFLLPLIFVVPIAVVLLAILAILVSVFRAKRRKKQAHHMSDRASEPR